MAAVEVSQLAEGLWQDLTWRLSQSGGEEEGGYRQVVRAVGAAFLGALCSYIPVSKFRRKLCMKKGSLWDASETLPYSQLCISCPALFSSYHLSVNEISLSSSFSMCPVRKQAPWEETLSDFLAYLCIFSTLNKMSICWIKDE